MLPIIGLYERAVEESTEGIRLFPDWPLSYAFRIRACTALDRFDEAKATDAQALERKLHGSFIDYAMYNLAFAQNDTAGMAQQVAKLESLPRWGHQVLNLEGDTAAYSGHLDDAHRFSRRAMDNAQRAGEKDAPGLYSGISGLREAWFGNPEEARRHATLALKFSTSRDVVFLPRSRWLIPGMTRERKRWPMIWTRGFRKTRLCSSIICRASVEGLRLTKEMLLEPL